MQYSVSPLIVGHLPACQAGGRGFESLRSRSLKPRFLIERSGVFFAHIRQFYLDNNGQKWSVFHNHRSNTEHFLVNILGELCYMKIEN